MAVKGHQVDLRKRVTLMLFAAVSIPWFDYSYQAAIEWAPHAMSDVQAVSAVIGESCAIALLYNLALSRRAEPWPWDTCGADPVRDGMARFLSVVAVTLYVMCA